MYIVLEYVHCTYLCTMLYWLYVRIYVQWESENSGILDFIPAQYEDTNRYEFSRALIIPDIMRWQFLHGTRVNTHSLES